MTKNTLHVLGLAHLPTVAEDPIFACAYSQKIRRFCEMMTNIGYDVIFYGVEGSRVRCKENVVVLSEDDRNRIYGPLDQFAEKFFQHGKNDPAYTIFIQNAIREIRERVKKNDVLCNPMGNYYEDICKPVNQGGVEFANGYPWLVESGIGYDGILLNTHRVFESNAWRHYVYGIYKAWTQNKMFVNGDFYDTVVPNFYLPEHYKFREDKEDFFFMNCRIANRKGIDIAVKTCEATGDHLIIAGQPGEDVKMDSPNVQYIGYVSEKEKLELLSRAKGLFSPTLYIGPFEGVTVEALMSGTPVISTDFGCYTETIPSTVGFRCMVLKEFVKAAKNIETIAPLSCRRWAVEKFSTTVCAQQYDTFFGRLTDLWGQGWGELGTVIPRVDGASVRIYGGIM